MAKDILGGFHIPSHLMEKAKAYTPPEKPKAKPATPISYKTKFPLKYGSGHEIMIEHIKGSPSKSTGRTPIHTVSGYIDNLSGTPVFKCTCQGYRIQGKGFCKHTKLIASKYEFVGV